MKCFSSCMSTRKRLALEEKERLFEPCSPISSGSPDGLQNSSSSSFESERQHLSSEDKRKMAGRSSAQSFEYRELAVATKNFKDSNLIGEGGFGKVYKGYLNGQVVAVKKLALDGLQGNQEFLVEVLMLSLLHHPNLVTLIGYCAEEDQRLLVYEYMPKGSLSDHLYNVAYEEDVLDWSKRLKIAAGAARGIQHLHMVANPPVIYRDLKSANILLDENFSPKLSDFGLAKLGPTDDKTHVSTRVMGTYGYCAPEYAASGKLSSKSDIYSFGVVLLELVTGKKALDLTKSSREQSLVMWARPFIKDRRRYMELLDPRLKGRVPTHSARHFIAVAGMCLKEDAGGRPTIDEIVKALDYLASEAQSPRSATGPRTSTALSSAGSTPTDSTATNSSPFSVRGSHFSRKFK